MCARRPVGGVTSSTRYGSAATMIDCASATEAVGVVERSGFLQVNDMLSAKPEAFLSARAVRARSMGVAGATPT
ncbi:MAG: hypothetical protein EBY57_11970 [Actinobacteria bacterium]|nr:hypothetical protein [Actinomycetota bacterium]